jgi:hypothetical protein
MAIYDCDRSVDIIFPCIRIELNSSFVTPKKYTFDTYEYNFISLLHEQSPITRKPLHVVQAKIHNGSKINSMIVYKYKLQKNNIELVTILNEYILKTLMSCCSDIFYF